MLRPKQIYMQSEPHWHTAANGERVWGPVRACWDGQPKRAPKAGELFISGSVPIAYRAKQDMSTEYFIATVL